jgi:hypothetical protein
MFRSGRACNFPSGRRYLLAGETMNFDQDVVGKIGRVTGTIAPQKVGEVMIPIRGGSEAFAAYAGTGDEILARGERVVVIEYHPPRTVIVTPA